MEPVFPVGKGGYGSLFVHLTNRQLLIASRFCWLGWRFSRRVKGVWSFAWWVVGCGEQIFPRVMGNGWSLCGRVFGLCLCRNAWRGVSCLCRLVFELVL